MSTQQTVWLARYYVYYVWPMKIRWSVYFCLTFSTTPLSFFCSTTYLCQADSEMRRHRKVTGRPCCWPRTCPTTSSTTISAHTSAGSSARNGYCFGPNNFDPKAESEETNYHASCISSTKPLFRSILPHILFSYWYYIQFNRIIQLAWSDIIFIVKKEE